MKAFYCDHFVLPLPPEHRFPMEKYGRLRERVVAAGVVAAEELVIPHAATDEEYLAALAPALATALAEARADLAIYVSGADPHERDRLGRLKLTRAGLRERDRLVFAACAARRLPVAVVMAGGYNQDVAETVEIHLQTVEEAKRYAEGWHPFRFTIP